MALNELVVERVLETDEVTKPIFLGAFARNELPSKPPFPSCFIVNTDPRNLPGTHWLAIYYNQHGICYFFDSYGNNPARYRLRSYISRTSRRWTYNIHRLQGDSMYCGYYCILFLLYISRGQLSEFFKHFNNSIYRNDFIIERFINQYKH